MLLDRSLSNSDGKPHRGRSRGHNVNSQCGQRTDPRSGFENLAPHDLRRTCARLCQASASPQLWQHAFNPGTAGFRSKRSWYAHPTQDHQARSVERMERLVAEQRIAAAQEQRQQGTLVIQ
jgi:hypothetical protein